MTQTPRWHYTVGAHIPSILHDGVIKPATSGVPTGERPIVWCSSNPVWEQTANKGLMIEAGGPVIDLNMEETARYCGGLYRIGIRPEAAPHNFERIVFLAKISPKWADGMVTVAREQGADPTEWFGTVHPVERANWVIVEKRSEAGIWQMCNEIAPDCNKELEFPRKAGR